MQNLILIKKLYEALFLLNAAQAQSYFTPDAMFLGKSSQEWINEQINWFKEHFFAKFENKLPLIEVTICDLIGGENIIRVFQEKVLILEEEILFKEGLILGTPYNVDCFGKIVFTNFAKQRALTIHPPPGKSILNIVFKNPDINYGFNNGSSFAKDNFSVSNFEIENDDFLTRIEKVKFYFSDGTKESRYIVCRGLDFPNFHSEKHVSFINLKQVLLEQQPTDYYFIHIGNKNNKVEYIGANLKGMSKLIEVDFPIQFIRLCVDGPAFEYEMNIE